MLTYYFGSRIGFIVITRFSHVMLCMLLYFQDRMLMELHSQGKTIEDIAECLKKVPLNPRTISSIKSAHASGYFPKLKNSIHTMQFDLIGPWLN